MTGKVLYIHAGGSKTGSSALQSFLYNNASRLEELDYAYSKNDIVINKNGIKLYKWLSSANANDNQIDRMVLNYFGQCNRAICSNEVYQYLKSDGWRKLVGSSYRLGFAIKVIFYVRNVLPFFQSSYDQVIKSNGEWKLFDEWVVMQDWHHANMLRIIADELPQSSFQILHYESERKNLITGFLNILEIAPSFTVSQSNSKQLINRSLNNREREALLAINKVLGQPYSAEITHLLTSLNPNARAEPVSYEQSTADILLECFSTKVDWVNKSFFNARPVVSVLPLEPEKERDKNALPENYQSIDIDKHVLNLAIEKRRTIQSETEQRIIKALNNATQLDSGALLPDLPTDFDALAYLLLNPDVLHACFDPVKHYLIHGKKEGRIYSF